LNQDRINQALKENNASLTIVDNDCFKTTSENIIQIGWIDFVNDIKNYDFFISFSKYESHPLAVMEAICNKVPVFLSNIEAHKEFDLPPMFYFDHIDFFEKFGEFIFHTRKINSKLIEWQLDAVASKYPSKKKWSQHLLKVINSVVQ